MINPDSARLSFLCYESDFGYLPKDRHCGSLPEESLSKRPGRDMFRNNEIDTWKGRAHRFDLSTPSTSLENFLACQLSIYTLNIEF